MASIKELYKAGLMSAKRLTVKELKAAVTDAYPETIKDQKEGEKTKLVLELDDGEYRIALNATQAKSLAKAWGDETDDWKGKKVHIKKGKTHFGNSLVDCLEVSPTK